MWGQTPHSWKPEANSFSKGNQSERKRWRRKSDNESVWFWFYYCHCTMGRVSRETSFKLVPLVWVSPLDSSQYHPSSTRTRHLRVSIMWDNLEIISLDFGPGNSSVTRLGCVGSFFKYSSKIGTVLSFLLAVADLLRRGLRPPVDFWPEEEEVPLAPADGCCFLEAKHLVCESVIPLLGWEMWWG